MQSVTTKRSSYTADVAVTPSEPREAWLIVTVSSSGGSSTLRVHSWRKLRSLGALYLHKSVAVLPHRPETARAVNRLVDRVRREGGQATTWSIELTDPAQERELIERFQAERADEYNEVCSRVPAFLAEIEQERARGRTTYAEVEESEADLDRLRTWLSRVEARDYFAAPGAADAAAAVERCTQALAAFEADALRAEAPEPTAEDHTTGRPKLRALKGQR